MVKIDLLIEIILFFIGIIWTIYTIFELIIGCKNYDPIYCNPLWIVGRLFFPVILVFCSLWLIYRSR